MKNGEDFIKEAFTLGATNAVKFQINDIVFDPRTLLKCMFGCTDWGIGHTCPSREGSLKPWEYEKILSRYKWGVIIHSHDKQISQAVSFEIERSAFLDGYYMAFSLSDCAICSGCKGDKCANPKKARPAFHSVGIDVFATIRKFDLPIKTLKDENDEQNWYSAVFIE